MNIHRISSTYSNAFQTFLSHTNEKPVLLKTLTERLRKISAKSFLDIGAGNGDLALPLSKTVERYVALEQKEDYVHRLREAGIEVIHSTYPTHIEEKFDAVLLCHALPPHSEGRVSWEPFITSAWSHVGERGHLLIVTFEDEDSEWNNLVQTSGLELLRKREERLASIKDCLQKFGTVQQNTITTHVTTDTLEKMVDSLAFVWSDGLDKNMRAFQENENVREYIKTNNFDFTTYSFPFTHYLLDVTQ